MTAREEWFASLSDIIEGIYLRRRAAGGEDAVQGQGPGEKSLLPWTEYVQQFLTLYIY